MKAKLVKKTQGNIDVFRLALANEYAAKGKDMKIP